MTADNTGINVPPYTTSNKINNLNVGGKYRNIGNLYSVLQPLKEVTAGYTGIEASCILSYCLAKKTQQLIQERYLVFCPTAS